MTVLPSIDRQRLKLRLELCRLMPAASGSLTVGAVLVVAVGAVLPPLIIVYVGRAVAEMGPAVRGGARSSAAGALYLTVAVLGAFVALQQATVPLLIHFSDQLGLRAKTLVFRRLMAAHLRPSSIAHLEDPSAKDLVERAQQPGGWEIRRGVQGFIMRWSRRLTALGALVLLGAYRWWAGLAMLAVLVFATRRAAVAQIEISRRVFAQNSAFRRSNYLRDLLMRPGAEKETRVFDLGAWITGRFSETWTAAMAPVWERRRHSLRETVLAVAPVVVMMAGIGAFATSQALAHQLSADELVVVLQALVACLVAISVSPQDSLVELGLSTLDSARALESALGARESTAGGRDAGALPSTEVRFDAVHFAYPGSEREILRGLDLTIPVGKSLAIVGANGAGKTTLIKLLLGLYDPTAGQISVDGLPLDELDPRAWQRRSAAVFQDFQRYPWSAAENVALRRGADSEVLDRVAERAGAASIIAALPQGWDTILARAFGGVDLSGGEWQRIALARALYAGACGAGLLVLDEPTSHLDVRQEASFYERFLDVTEGWTTIIVSHRFSTVRRADRIVVLEAGSLVERGTHEELVAAKGQYATMFALQAEHYAASEEADA